MKKIDPAVLRETTFVAVSVLVFSILLQGLFLLLGQWNYTVLLGSLLGAFTATLNFFLMALSVQNALERDKTKAAQYLRFSQSGRMLMQGAALVLAGVLPCFNLWAAIAPLLVPTVAVRIRQWRLAKRNPAPDRAAIGWDDDEEEEDD